MAKTDEEVRRWNKNGKLGLKVTGNDDAKTLCLVNSLANRKRKSKDPADQAVMKIFALKPPSFYREAMTISYNLEAPPPLSEIKVPTLILHGDADDTIPFDSAKHLTDYIPRSEFKAVQGGEHNMVYTRADDLIAYIRAWLKQAKAH